jgi:uncharacterized protein (DUF885 family)/metal-dependent hydrolase (beta-lactamase superfamily II)
VREETALQPAKDAPAVREAAELGTPAGTLTASLEGLDLDAFFEISWRELSLRDPETVLADGLAEVYGLEGAELTNISDAYVRETYDMYATVLEMLRTYDRDQLTPEQQVSYDVYEFYLDDRVRQQEFIYYDYPATFFPVTAVHEQTADFFADLHPIANKQDAEDYVKRLQQVGPKFEQLLEGLKLREEAGIVPPKFANQWALYGVRNTAQSSATQTRFYQAFEEKVALLDDVSDAERQALLKSAADAIDEAVLPAFRALAETLQHLESIAPTDVGLDQFPGGDAYYAHLLRHYTTTNMTADEIHELGVQELERIHRETRSIFDQLGYPQDESLPELFDRVAQDGGQVSGNQVIETYEELIEQADQDLTSAFDLRPQADVIVVKSPIAGMYVSASLDGSRPGAFHAGPGNTTQARYAMPTLAYHEAVPGHHFQIALAQESNLPSFRNSVHFLGYTEGWALYAEQLASELGWYEGDPYGDLGRLQAEALRAARLVVDTGLHARGWTFDEALEFFIENTGYESSDSVDPDIQIARYIVWPGQSTAYKIGMIKMLELRQRAMDLLGDRFDLKEFHSIVLTNGSMPLEVLERVVDDYIQAELASSPPAETPSSTDASTTASPSESDGATRHGAGLRMSIVYDNTAYDPELEARWGFAAVLEYDGHTLLFDTGGDGLTLLNNMEMMGLDPQTIEAVILSHIHGDHTDGLEGLLNTGVRPKVYVPVSFPSSFKDLIGARTEVVEVTDPLEIYPGVHSTGELRAAVNEQGLVVETSEGSVVITGCAHPGITRMVRTAGRIVDDEMALVIGGFHLGDAAPSRIEGIIADFRELGVRQVSPTHCTGEKAINMFTEAYGEDCVQGGVGRVIVAGDLQ